MCERLLSAGLRPGWFRGFGADGNGPGRPSRCRTSTDLEVILDHGQRVQCRARRWPGVRRSRRSVRASDQLLDVRAGCQDGRLAAARPRPASRVAVSTVQMAVHGAGGQHRRRRGEAVAAEVVRLPDPPGGQLGEGLDDRTAEQGTAFVALAVGADQERRAVDRGQRGQRGDDGSRVAVGQTPSRSSASAARRGRRCARRAARCGRAPCRRRTPAVRPVLGRRRRRRCRAGGADQAEPDVGLLRRVIDPRAEVGVQLTLGRRLGTPRAGLFDDEPAGGDDRRTGDRLVQLPAEGRAEARPAGRVES